MNPAKVVVGEVEAVGGPRFSSFFLKPFVNRARRRMDMRIVRFWRSTMLVQIRLRSGFPMTGTTSVDETSAGL